MVEIAAATAAAVGPTNAEQVWRVGRWISSADRFGAVVSTQRRSRFLKSPRRQFVLGRLQEPCIAGLFRNDPDALQSRAAEEPRFRHPRFGWTFPPPYAVAHV